MSMPFMQAPPECGRCHGAGYYYKPVSPTLSLIPLLVQTQEALVKKNATAAVAFLCPCRFGRKY